MGRSTASCFKIIACCSDPVDHDDLQTMESKGSSGHCRWSLQKRSARHRVLSNGVAADTPSFVNKETRESTDVNLQVQPDLTVPEKTSVVQWTEEKTEMAAQLDSKSSDTIGCKKDDLGADETLDEPSVIVIQSAVRGLLAQRMLLRQKSIVKLQAVVRGHLVRKYAVGTLRCVQAIIKMQALVRARHACLLVGSSGDFSKQSESSGKDNNDSTLLKKTEAKPNGSYTCASMVKLLSNAFTRQLMESTPWSKPINIKCDPSKSDSAWKWLERWMSVSSATSEEPLESESAAEQCKEDLRAANGKEDILGPFDCYSVQTGFNSGVAASAEASEDDENLISFEANNLNPFSSKSVSPSSSHSELHIIDRSNSSYNVTKSASIGMKEADLNDEVEANSLLEEEISARDRPDLNRFSTKQPETEAKKFPRKASNPAFIAVQSKFEELSSAAPCAKLTTSSICGTGVESSLDKLSSSEQRLRSRDFELAYNAISNASAVYIGGSECGTELSISSTLDSPDRSEAGVLDIEKETKVSNETGLPRNRERLELESNGKSTKLETDLSYTNSSKLEKYENPNLAAVESPNSITAADSVQLGQAEAEPCDLQLKLECEASHPVNKSSSETSPRSHITVPESQAVPSSEVSVKPKKNKGEKSDSNLKSRSSSADKKSLSNRNPDSASRSSLEQVLEHKSGKRRNSFGSAKADHREHEPGDSSSGNSLPSYMQATESARAKAMTNNSPRSSPDVHDKDIYIKKRRSLPGSNERQVSPRIQHSLSHAQQNAKGNGTHSPQEPKWRR